MTAETTKADKWRERKELARQAWRRLRGGELTPMRAALSVGVGLLVGMTPAFGFHWLLVLAICMPLRLDTGVSYLASNISMPLIAPFITFSEIELGTYLLHGRWSPLRPEDMKALAIGTIAAELLVGTAIVAPLGAAIGGAITYAVVSWRRRRATPHHPA
ncbi:MAG: DUF2062 domain-containing protein [Deltaproteobacteria bacterium]|nr:DUF2062 domain-containing protein [Deltaproteobacteria bacterium]